MNEYIFYTAEGRTDAPNESRPVENCQVLGKARGRHPAEAKANLLAENPWIVTAGFAPSEFFSAQLLTNEQRNDINALLASFKPDVCPPKGAATKKARSLFEAVARLQTI